VEVHEIKHVFYLLTPTPMKSGTFSNHSIIGSVPFKSHYKRSTHLSPIVLV